MVPTGPESRDVLSAIPEMVVRDHFSWVSEPSIKKITNKSSSKTKSLRHLHPVDATQWLELRITHNDTSYPLSVEIFESQRKEKGRRDGALFWVVSFLNRVYEDPGETVQDVPFSTNAAWMPLECDPDGYQSPKHSV